jgi:hypothetical protein
MELTGEAVSETTIHPNILSGYGLIEAPFEVASSRLGSYKRADSSEARVVSPLATAADALDFLSVRTFPATRLVFVDLGPWTAVLTNSRNGSDFNDHQYWAGRTVGARTVRVVDAETRWWRRGKLRIRLSYEARSFELHQPDDSTVRSIVCMLDGDRWVFETSGQPLPIEASFDYDAPKKSDRFTRQNLRDLLEELGPGHLDDERLLAAPRFGLAEERITNDERRARVETWACSLEQADDPAFGLYLRGMGYVPYMKTHAQSVIHDFERAIEVNPAYEPKVRNYLREAHRVVGSRASRLT